MKDRLNPKIRKFEYGNKEMFSVDLYPLSIGDQKKALEIVLEVVQEFASPEFVGKSDVEVAPKIVEILNKHIVAILAMIAGVPAESAQAILDRCTNDQFVLLIDTIWEVNFEDAVKNGMSLFDKIRMMYPSKRQSQFSYGITPNTGLNTSTPEASEKEESQETKC